MIYTQTFSRWPLRGGKDFLSAHCTWIATTHSMQTSLNVMGKAQLAKRCANYVKRFSQDTNYIGFRNTSNARLSWSTLHEGFLLSTLCKDIFGAHCKVNRQSTSCADPISSLCKHFCDALRFVKHSLNAFCAPQCTQQCKACHTQTDIAFSPARIGDRTCVSIMA